MVLCWSTSTQPVVAYAVTDLANALFYSPSSEYQKQFAFIVRVMFTFLRITSALVQCPCLVCRGPGQFITHQGYSVLYSKEVIQVEAGEEQVDAIQTNVWHNMVDKYQ